MRSRLHIRVAVLVIAVMAGTVLQGGLQPTSAVAAQAEQEAGNQRTLEDLARRWGTTVEEVKTRLDLEPAVQELHDSLLSEPGFAGLWVDNQGGGIVHVAFAQDTDRNFERARNRVDAQPRSRDQREELKSRMRPFAAARTLQELENIVERLNGDVLALRAEGIELAAWEKDVRAGHVNIRVVDLTAAERQTLRERYGNGDVLNISAGELATAAHTPGTCGDRFRCFNPHRMRGGINISVPAGSCSVGFWAREGNYTGSVFVSNGHCGGVGGVVSHDGLRVGTIRQSDIIGVLDGAIVTDERGEGDNNYYHNDNDRTRRVNGVYTGASASFVDYCTSGRTSGLRCGGLADNNASVCRTDGRCFTNQMRLNVCTQGGDSGSGMYRVNGIGITQYSIVHAGLCGGANNVAYASYIGHFQNHFGIKFVTAGVHGY